MGSMVADWLASFLQLIEWLRLELLLFAGFWFVVGAIDELLIDGAWFGLRLAGRAYTPRLFEPLPQRLSAPVALFVAA
jgi:adsorption protein B